MAAAATAAAADTTDWTVTVATLIDASSYCQLVVIGQSTGNDDRYAIEHSPRKPILSPGRRSDKLLICIQPNAATQRQRPHNLHILRLVACNEF